MTDLTYVDNVVEAMLLCLKSPAETLGRKYHITNGEPIKLWPFIQHLSEQLGYPPPQRHVPRWLAYQVAGMMERYYSLFRPNQEPPLTRYAVGLLATTFTLDITAARQELGYQPKINMEEALAQTLRYGQE
jgi:nucleoside-diphosphate-sugar epimerase